MAKAAEKESNVTTLPAASPVTVKNKGGKKRAPEGETARQKFIRIATARVQAAEDAIRLVSSIGLGREYEYTEADAIKISQKLGDALAAANRALKERKAVKSQEKLFE